LPFKLDRYLEGESVSQSGDAALPHNCRYCLWTKANNPAPRLTGNSTQAQSKRFGCFFAFLETFNDVPDPFPKLRLPCPPLRPRCEASALHLLFDRPRFASIHSEVLSFARLTFHPFLLLLLRSPLCNTHPHSTHAPFVVLHCLSPGCRHFLLLTPHPSVRLPLTSGTPASTSPTTPPLPSPTTFCLLSHLPLFSLL